MPGTRLSETEKKLQKKWDSPSQQANYLRSIEVQPLEPDQPATGLRGINNVTVNFGYPVTVLVGTNGSGKSTVLNLAALAFRGDTHSPSGRPKPGYRFPDFFFSVRGEAQPTNFTIKWSILYNSDKRRNTRMLRKSTRKWMDYNRRHNADVTHIGLGRINSWSESSSHKRAFVNDKQPTSTNHVPWISDAMTRIFSQTYNSSTSLSAGKYVVPQVRRESAKEQYSGFNMGTGEAATIAILEEVAKTPRGSLILIEEIEMAIHPSAQRTLATVLLERALSHDLQIICTSHSRWFIDALPRQARILIQPNDDAHVCIPNVTTRMAEGTLLGRHEEELLIICEDTVGQMIIESALPMEDRKRAKIVPCGSKSELCRAASFTHLVNRNLPVLIVFDGDTTDAEVQSALNAADGGQHLEETRLVEWSRIGPGEIMSWAYNHSPNDAPEVQMKKRILESTQALDQVAYQFNTDVHGIRQILQSAALGLANHHSLFYDIHEKTSTNLEFVALRI